MQLLAAQALAHPDQFRHLAHERYGGVTAVRRAIAAERLARLALTGARAATPAA